MVQQVSQSFDDGEAQPETAALLALCALIIFLEYVWQLIFGHSDAAVPDFYTDLIGVAAAAQYDCPTIGVPDRIRQQIPQHFLQHAFFAANHYAGTHQTPAQATLLNRAGKVSGD